MKNMVWTNQKLPLIPRDTSWAFLRFHFTLLSTNERTEWLNEEESSERLRDPVHVTLITCCVFTYFWDKVCNFVPSTQTTTDRCKHWVYWQYWKCYRWRTKTWMVLWWSSLLTHCISFQLSFLPLCPDPLLVHCTAEVKKPNRDRFHWAGLGL